MGIVKTSIFSSWVTYFSIQLQSHLSKQNIFRNIMTELCYSSFLLQIFKHFRPYCFEPQINTSREIWFSLWQTTLGWLIPKNYIHCGFAGIVFSWICSLNNSLDRQLQYREQKKQGWEEITVSERWGRLLLLFNSPASHQSFSGPQYLVKNVSFSSKWILLTVQFKSCKSWYGLFIWENKTILNDLSTQPFKIRAE